MAARPKSTSYQPRPQQVGFATKPERQPELWHLSQQIAVSFSKMLVADGKPFHRWKIIKLLHSFAAVFLIGRP